MPRLAEAAAVARGWAGRHRRLLVACGAALSVYALLGFLLLPRIVHRQLGERLSALLHREVSIERVRTNPFALSVTIEKLLVKQQDGTPGASWDRLYVNFELWALVLKEIRFSEISLERPFLELAVLREGSSNVSDILASFERGGEGPAPEKPGRPWTFGVDRLAIEGASIAFRDETRPAAFRTTLGPVTVRVQSFHTRADSRSPYSFAGKTESGEGFSWTGSFFIDPLRSQGSFALDDLQLPKYAPYYQPEVGFELRDGVASLKSAYDLEWSAARRVLRLQGGSLQVRKLALALRGAADPLLELPALDVAGVDADLVGGHAEVASVAVKDPVLRVRRDRAGQVNLARLAGPERKGAAPGAGAPPAAAAQAYRYLVKQVALVNGRLDLEDLVPERPVRLDLQKLGATIGDVSSDPEASSPVEASLEWPGGGRVEAKGRIQPSRQRGEIALRVEGLALAPIDPYLLTFGDLDVKLADGRLGADLRLGFDRSKAEPSYQVSGDGRIDALVAADAARNVEALRWRSLQMVGLQATTRPARSAIRSVTWVEPQVRAQVDPDGSSNLQRIRRLPPEKAAAAAQPPAPASTTPPAAEVPAPPPAKPPPARAPPAGTAAQASLGSFQIVRGRLSYSDRSVNPAVAVSCTDLEARARGISSAPEARPQLAASCKVWGASPFEISGTLHPLFKGDGTDLKIVSRGIDLTPLGPYAGKHLGYGIQKGKLDLDLGYAVVQRRLDAKNLVRIDQLTLGDKTDSPDATSLPVKLGIAILRDRDGVILLDVPVSGNVDDPDFRVGKVVWRAIGNVFIKAATAPFALLAGVFGGGEENLDLVDFPPGSPQLDEGAAGKLQVLAKALFERPALQLDIEGTADLAADGPALRKKALAGLVRQAKASAARESPESVQVPPAEYSRWLEAAYRAAFPGPDKPGPDGKAHPPTAADMEARLAASIAVPPEELRDLASRRAAAARDRILAAAQVDAGRIFMVEGGERAAKEKGARAYFTLR